MNPSGASYVSSRVFKLNVGFLLSDGPGHSQDSAFDIPTVRIAEDLQVDYVRGRLRLSRTKEGILVQAVLQVGVKAECYRCLDPFAHEVTITLEELYAYPVPITAEFSVHDDGILDLGPLLRAEVLIAAARRVLCRPDCKGLCPDCGANLNHSVCTCHLDAIDPRMAVLRKLLDR